MTSLSAMLRYALPLGACLTAVGCSPEVPRPPSANETCFGLSEANEYCDEQACFPKELEIIEKDSAAPGFRCSYLAGETCPTAPAGGGGFTAWYTFETDAGTVGLSFSDRILAEGYSLENFRKYVTSATIGKTVDGVTLNGPFVPEFVSYRDGLLHVRSAGEATEAASYPNDVPLHECYDGHLGRTYLCTSTHCQYGASAAADGGIGARVRFTVDVEAPVQLPAP